MLRKVADVLRGNTLFEIGCGINVADPIGGSPKRNAAEIRRFNAGRCGSTRTKANRRNFRCGTVWDSIPIRNRTQILNAVPQPISICVLRPNAGPWWRRGRGNIMFSWNRLFAPCRMVVNVLARRRRSNGTAPVMSLHGLTRRGKAR